LIDGIQVSPQSVRPGDRVLLSGPVGDHGITILLARGELDMEADICSDTRSVLPLVEAMAAAAGGGIRWMRDPTRGGVATYPIVVRSDYIPRIQEVQASVYHMIREMVEEMGRE
jgi:hydrogenase maturation factor